jgi:hypothetical protein
VPLIAPTGSSITLTSATNALPTNGTATIIAQVLESAGTPPHSGTRVTFTTTLGTIDPPEASTDTSGRATVTFKAGNASGVATIAASSGGATTSTATSGTGSGGTTTTTDRNLKIAIGAAAVGRVNVAANPAVLPTNGGIATIVANVLDINGNALSSAPVTFTTTAGSLSQPTVSTDANGNASTQLTTFQEATVTATVGVAATGSGGSGNGGTTTTTTPNQATVKVSLTSAPTLSITVPTTLPSAGLPSVYTFKVTPASSSGTGTGGGTGGTTTSTIAIKELFVTWGDGLTDNLGAVSGEQTVVHTYARAGSYPITGTVTDVAGGTARVSTSVTVIPVPAPTISITYSPVPAKVNGQTIISVQITIAPGLSVLNATINFGDGTSAGLGGGTSASQPHVYTVTGTYTVTVTVTDSSGQTTSGFTSVSVTS